jgi:hypothetical protein
MKIRHLFVVLGLLSAACTIPLSVSQTVVTGVVEEKQSVVLVAPLPPTTDMTVLGFLRLRDAPDNTGSRTLAVIPSGEIFHVQRRTTVHSTDWAYGSWYDGEKWLVGYVAARFLR